MGIVNLVHLTTNILIAYIFLNQNLFQFIRITTERSSNDISLDSFQWLYVVGDFAWKTKNIKKIENTRRQSSSPLSTVGTKTLFTLYAV